ncbi:hypothetical protein BDN70DRAFT_891683 [Pholiota conissans]|uniref:BTB domain-containing protein n=1 Tax=Pholiota conissans TaxID=109636 RepID=A0A9P6D4L3_9AGAR|nr:hypothetical protein BDN70DRAFT_891683 [Pholiota conissans]
METRSRKRQRSGSIDQDTVDSNTIELESDHEDETAVRDEHYYKEDGDCVILVGKVLFKIHSFLLKRDASTFEDMFNMPQGTAKDNKMNTDENPLIVYDDVDDFRALCWIIPTVYTDQQSLSKANIKNLVSLFIIAQKYHFESHESFSRNLLRKHCASLESKPTSKFNYFRKVPESRLQTLLRIAVLTEKSYELDKEDSLTSLLQSIWIKRLEDKNDLIRSALTVGEDLGLRKFVAELYYLELTRTKPLSLDDHSLAYAHPVVDLGVTQKLALFQGSWSLRCYWSKMVSSFRAKPFACVKNKDHQCGDVWDDSWAEYISRASNPEPFDPLEGLSKINDIIVDAGERDKEGRAYDCAMQAIDTMKTGLKDSFAEHFLGPLPKLDTRIKSST